MHLFLVAPDSREHEVREQLLRPAFHSALNLSLRFLPYGALREHRETIARFGTGMKGIEAIARTMV